MFDKLKAMGALAGLMGKREALREVAERVKTKSAAARLVGSAGGGAVRVTVSGALKVVSVEIAPALAAGIAADDKTRILAGNLITEAVNDGLSQAQAHLKDAIDAEARALGLPELLGLDQLIN
jgi:DNA-binding protein YbaB